MISSVADYALVGSQIYNYADNHALAIILGPCMEKTIHINNITFTIVMKIVEN